MMLTKIKQFMKKYWIFILLAALATGLFLLRLIQSGQPPVPSPAQPTPTTQPLLTQPKINGVLIPVDAKLIFTDFSFPPQLKTYLGQESRLSESQAKKIAQKLKFSQSPQESKDVFLGDFYTWSSKTHFLSIALNSNLIKYGLDLYQAQAPKGGLLPSPEEARKTLEDFLANLELSSQLEPKWQKEEYLVQGFYLLPTNTPQEADFIRVGFNLAIGQHQLVSSDPNEPLVYLILSKGGEIIRFQSQIYYSSFEGQETHNLKDLKEVQSTLTTEGKIVYAGTHLETFKELKLTQAEFSQITLAYYQDPNKNPILQPIYILSGQGTLENGEKTEIIAYLPAIKFGTQNQENLEVPREFFQLPELP